MVRRAGRADAVHGGALSAAMLRECPVCGAKPGRSCTFYVAARVDGKDIGGGYERLMKHPHGERKRKQGA